MLFNQKILHDWLCKFIEGREGGGGGNKVHYGHMKMVNSRDYNGNGYELWQNDF